MARLLVSLARNVSTEATLSTLSSDTGGGQPIDPRTTASYLSALERLFVVEDVPAWSPQLRSRSRLRGAPKRQLVDPSLAAAALSADPARLLADLETLGFLFESMCVRDLRVYCQMMRAELSHYRDNTGLEVDTIIRQRNGEWMAAEIKLGGRAAVEAAAASLVKLRDDRIDPSRVGEPRRLVVITATGFAYETHRRRSGGAHHCRRTLNAPRHGPRRGRAKCQPCLEHPMVALLRHSPGRGRGCLARGCSPRGGSA